MRITPLSAWGETAPPVTGTLDPAVDNETEPLRQTFALDAHGFFAYAADLLAEHGPHAQDYPVLDRLARVGFVSGQRFDLTAADPVTREALTRAVPAAQKRISDEQTRIGEHREGWQVVRSGMGNYGTDYLRRACVELIGLGANLQDDAIYPITYLDADGEPFDGMNSYVWHLEKDNMPPVNAFWSLTLYDAEGFQVANELNRFAIGDRDDLDVNSDGSLDIHIQHTQPDSGTANWLPSPRTGYNLCARFYYPRQEILDGTWTPPPVRKV
jgi:hypothetical protein